MPRYLILLSILYSQFFIGISPAFAWDTLTTNLDLKCQQINQSSLHCDYRLLFPEPPLDIHASSEKNPLNIVDNRSFPWTDGITAILLIIDTSDPARQNVVSKNIEHVEILLQAIHPHHRIGLASFDKDLRIEVPIGASPSRIIASSKQLKAVGKTTELYRNMIKAISVLSNIDADRKVIFLFSDGQAEDKAYFHRDVIKAARKAKVIINSLGYPRSVSLSVALQTLRRLSEETGGLYIETNNNYELPVTFLESPFENVDRGGQFSIDLSPLTSVSNLTDTQVTLIFETDIGDISAKIPVSLPSIGKSSYVPEPEQVQSSARSEPQAPAIKVISPQTEQQDVDLWLWYGVPIALTVLLILMVITLIVIFQQKKSPKVAAPRTEYKPYAYLVTQDEKSFRYPITNTTWRIGRTKDNEMALQDKSVSRRHAEIHRYSNGNFIIFDVDSLNGVYVNDEKIKKKKLQEGDIIEIGDIYLRFTLYSSDYYQEDDTAVQQTKTPMH